MHHFSTIISQARENPLRSIRAVRYSNLRYLRIPQVYERFVFLHPMETADRLNERFLRLCPGTGFQMGFTAT